ADRTDFNTAAMVQRLQATMADDVGPFRSAVRLARALDAIDEMARALGEAPGGEKTFDLRVLEGFDLRNMLTVAPPLPMAAPARRESRGAHQREDFPGMLPQWRVTQVARLGAGSLTLTAAPVAAAVAAQ